MKRLFISVSVILLSVVNASSQQKGFVLNGYIAGIPDGKVLYLVRRINEDTVATAICQNGRFIFKWRVPIEAEYFWISFDTTVSKKPSEAIWLVNSVIQVRSSTKDWPKIEVKGSNVHEDFKKALSIYQFYRMKYDSLMHEKYVTKKKLEITESEIDTVQVKLSLKNIEKELQVNKVRELDSIQWFLKMNQNSMYSPYIIIAYKSEFGIMRTRSFYDQLTRKSKMSFYGLKLKEMIAAGDLEINKVLGDFEGITPEGNTVSLKEILSKNKYVLIDFWASWCKPCREENSNLKRAFQLYQSKGFNILSITSDFYPGAWKKAIERDTLSWFHLADKNYSAAIAKMYNINALPSYYLIDSAGKVVASDNPLQGTGGMLREGRLEQKLEELFGKKDE